MTQTTTTPMLTTQEAAERLRVHPITVQRWLRDGTLVGTKLPGKAGWRIPVIEVARLLRGDR
jgi:excisionase family DNA binding protein